MKKIAIMAVVLASLSACKKNLTDSETTTATSDPVYATPNADGTCPAGYKWVFMGRSLGYQCVKQ